MSQTLRQNNLFAGQDWTVIYQAMSQISFASYDYDTIRQALIDYIRINYPEDFNDWIESSEFVAIIEMLAYLAGSLAFRIDLNTRENFLDTATRRDSLMRLARFLSYTPRRCLAAQGLTKITQVRTDQSIYDSNGVNLANIAINWNDANNPDWLEQFVLVLNAALQSANPVGVPVKSGTVGTIAAQRYDFNNINTNTLAYSFSATVNGTAMQFEFANADFEVQTSGSVSVSNSGFFKEKQPNVFNSWSMVYRNDGNGNASANTGFFMLFKQGTLSYSDFILDASVPNRVIDIAATNVNQNDVWVQSIDSTGLPVLDWTRVPALFNSNLVYNNVNRLTRNIFQVVTRDQAGVDAISIRFGDGSFGNIPTGRIRVYYRVSNNLTYTIQPADLATVGLSLGYQSAINTVHNLSMQLSLSYTVANSLTRESSDSIRQRAPAVYYAQNRMVNGEDYNVFPLQNSQAVKIKAVNRTYSGQSRFLDINDPTGAYSNTKVFSDDGVIYEEYSNAYEAVLLSSNLNTNQIIDGVIQPLLSGRADTSTVSTALRDFYWSRFPKLAGGGVTWRTVDSLSSSTQGEFAVNGARVILPDLARGVTTGSMIRFNNVWTTVVNQGTSQLGVYSTLLSTPVADSAVAQSIMPPLRVTLNSAERAALSTALGNRRTFGFRYDQASLSWRVIDTQDLATNADFSLINQGNLTKNNLDASWLMQAVFQANQGWQFTCRGVKHVFESIRDVRFYFVNSQAVIDSVTLTSERDRIRVLKYNTGSSGSALGSDIFWSIQSQYVYPDGYMEPSEVNLDFWDSNNDGIVDNPDSFDLIVGTDDLVFWQRTVTQGSARWQPTTVSAVYARTANLPSLASTSLSTGSIVYVRDPGIFLELVRAQSGVSWKDVSSIYKARRGRSGLNYCWQHYAGSDRRIDPAIMNIIDVYVLTNSYNTSIRNWISKGRPNEPQPQPPTTEELRATFDEFNSYKMMTDQLVWHPIRYKLLFGAQAEPDMRAVFKVVKLSNTQVTDSEIKSRVIQAVDDYFGIANWDFGQSFYFTELAAYIHQQMPMLLSSVVIVPSSSMGRFGDLFEITSEPDQLFLNAARASDVQVVANLNPAELRIST